MSCRKRSWRCHCDLQWDHLTLVMACLSSMGPTREIDVPLVDSTSRFVFIVNDDYHHSPKITIIVVLLLLLTRNRLSDKNNKLHSSVRRSIDMRVITCRRGTRLAIDKAGHGAHRRERELVSDEHGRCAKAIRRHLRVNGAFSKRVCSARTKKGRNHRLFFDRCSYSIEVREREREEARCDTTPNPSMFSFCISIRTKRRDFSSLSAATGENSLPFGV